MYESGIEGAHFDAWSPNQWKAKCRSKGTLIFYGGILVSAHMQNWIMGMWKKTSEMFLSDNPYGPWLLYWCQVVSNQSGLGSNKDVRQHYSSKCIWIKLIDLVPVSTQSDSVQNRKSRWIYHITEAYWGTLCGFCHLWCDSLYEAGRSTVSGVS